MKKERGRPARRYRYKGVSLTLTEWADAVKCPRRRIYARLKLGWPLGAALMTDRKPQGRAA